MYGYFGSDDFPERQNIIHWLIPLTISLLLPRPIIHSFIHSNIHSFIQFQSQFFVLEFNQFHRILRLFFFFLCNLWYFPASLSLQKLENGKQNHKHKEKKEKNINIKKKKNTLYWKFSAKKNFIYKKNSLKRVWKRKKRNGTFSKQESFFFYYFFRKFLQVKQI